VRSLDMDGPFELTKDVITRKVGQTLPGNFALGRMTKEKKFIVRYVGRDDKDVRRALLQSLKIVQQPGVIDRLMGAEPGETHFKFSFARTADAAFEKHCRHFHNFNKNGQLRNTRHPRPPDDDPRKCPVCGERY